MPEDLQHFQIKCRFSGTVRFEGRFGSLRLCVEAAVKAGANLTDANLAGAYLAGANLTRANLNGAYLAGANLTRANLNGANLAGANLTDANLAGANLAGANLAGAYLAGAYLAGAYLAGANLTRANLNGANLAGANLAGANLADANLTDATIADDTNLTAERPIRRATRSDGYEFFLWQTDKGWRVRAGCRFFTLDEAWRHWEQTRGGTPLGDESLDIMTMFQLHVDRVGEAV